MFKHKFLILYFQGPSINHLLMRETYGVLPKKWRKETRNFQKKLCKIYYPATWAICKNQI